MKAESYHVDLDIDFKDGGFHGKVRLVGDLDTPTLRLNSLGLDVVRAVAGTHPLTIHVLEASQEVELDGLPAGAREVEVEFTGRATEAGLVGFYRSRQPPDYVLVTQFESTGARRLFPCLDRPDQKATFELDLTVDAGVQAIFNTPEVSSEVAGLRQRIRFGPTPRMSTYLMFLAVGSFDVLRGEGPGTPVAVWTPPGMREKGRFGLDVAQRVLREFESYYGVPYPLPKLDLISVRDFGAGAMENWGAISSRERLLLVDERTTSALRRAIATVTAHEIAHQWFGDLVTMQWWDDIWLNESFASFMAYKVLDRLGDIPGIWGDFLQVEMGGALLGDSLATTHPIRQSVGAPEEIDQVFDEISYGKGASVLRMLEGFVGHEPFRQGVHDYLVKFQYRNARSEDLWAALESAAGQPISDLMRRWVERPGLPVLIVHRSDGGLHLEQRRFSFSGDHPRQFWPLPLVARADGKPLRVLMAGPEITLHIPAGTQVFLNEGALGFYRVLYDRGTFESLRADFNRLAPAERWLVDQDLLAFLLSGDVPFSLWEGFLGQAVEETDPMVALGALAQFAELAVPLHGDGEFVALYRRFHAAHAHRLGLAPRPGEGNLEGRLRDLVLRARLLFDPEFAQEHAQRFARFDELAPDLRPSVAMAYAQTGGTAVAPELWKRFQAGDDAAQQQMARAMGAFDDPDALATALDRAGSGGMPFSQLPWMLFEAVKHPRSRPVVWTWFLTHRERFNEALSGTSFLSTVYEMLVGPIGADDLEAIRTYFAQNPVAAAERGIAKGLEYAQLFARLRARRLTESGRPATP